MEHPRGEKRRPKWHSRARYLCLALLAGALSCNAYEVPCDTLDGQCRPLSALALYGDASLLSNVIRVDWLVAVGDGGTIIYSADRGKSWQAGNSGTVTDLRGVGFVGGSRWVAVGLTDTMLVSDNGGKTWTPATTPSTGAVNHQSLATGGGTALAVGTVTNIFRSTDGGLTWTSTANPIAAVKNMADYLCGKFVFASNGSVAHTADGTGAVTSTPLPTFPTGKGACVGSRLVISTGAIPYNAFSDDAGASWSGGGAGITSIRRVVRLVGSTLIALGDDTTTQTSANATTWSAGSGLPAGNVKDGAVIDAQGMAVVGGTGVIPTVLYTENAGSSWLSASGAPATTFYGVAYGSIPTPQ